MNRKPVLRTEPDPVRPAVSTGVAAVRCRLSRYYVAELVKQGRLDGYGIRRQEGDRIRWYVYEDILPAQAEETGGTDPGSYERELLRHLLDARDHARLARDEWNCAHRLLIDAIDGMTDAVRAAQRGDDSRLLELLLHAQEIRNDKDRRLVKAQQHEVEAEACLDAALRQLLPPGEEDMSGTGGQINVASRKGLQSRGREHLTFARNTSPEDASARG